MDLVCLYYMEEKFTVKDIIRACSHMLGGVHTRNPENDREKLLCDWFENSGVELGYEFDLDLEKFGFILK
ncbi:MAG: hypothetical protein ABIO93_10575, partial [Dyadobacter sp.]|uniref:hypothetical protein n=1 Tax=Dyadobacter sp. TaxID=1914288 RepID=UPI003262E9A9